MLSDASTFEGSPGTTANLTNQDEEVNLSMNSSNSALGPLQNLHKMKIAESYGSSEDRAAYRQYHIHKMTNLVKECIEKKICFKQKYVVLSRHFLTDVASMPLHEIEILNMKCNQVLNNEASYLDSDEEKDGKETLPLKQKVPLQRPSRTNRPSESHENVQNYLVGFRTSASLPQTPASGNWAYSYHDQYNLPPSRPTSELNQVNQPFGTGFKFNNQDNQHTQYFTSTPTPQTSTYMQKSVQASPSFQGPQFQHNPPQQTPTNLTTPKNLTQPQFAPISPASTVQPTQQQVHFIISNLLKVS